MIKLGRSGRELYSYIKEIAANERSRYHAHSDVQRADGLYGGLVIHRPANSGMSEMPIYEYEEDLALIIGDWYHRSAQDVQDYYTDWTNFGLEESDTLLRKSPETNIAPASPGLDSSQWARSFQLLYGNPSTAYRMQ